MRTTILAVDESLPAGEVEQIWYFVDRRDSASIQRCTFRNSAIVERHMKALLAKCPDIRFSPDDFYFVHTADELHRQEGDDFVCYIKYYSGDEIKEFKDYAN